MDPRTEPSEHEREVLEKREEELGEDVTSESSGQGVTSTDPYSQTAGPESYESEIAIEQGGASEDQPPPHGSAAEGGEVEPAPRSPRPSQAEGDRNDG